MAGGDRCGKSILERTTPIRKSKGETDGSESKPAISGSKSAYVVLPVVVIVVVVAVVMVDGPSSTSDAATEEPASSL